MTIIDQPIVLWNQFAGYRINNGINLKPYSFLLMGIKWSLLNCSANGNKLRIK